MAMFARSQSRRTPNQSRSTSAVSKHGTIAKNKDHLKSDKAATMSGNPAAQQDQYGSRHNVDNIKKEQRRSATPGGSSDLAFRESAQDTHSMKHGAKNRIAGSRSKPKARKAAQAKAKAAKKS